MGSAEAGCPKQNTGIKGSFLRIVLEAIARLRVFAETDFQQLDEAGVYTSTLPQSSDQFVTQEQKRVEMA